MEIRLLMLVRDPSWFGGVVNYVQLLERNLEGGVKVEEFHMGRRKNQSGRWLRSLIPFIDMMRLAYRLFFNRYDVIHINPSLNRRSLFRDYLFMLVMKMHRINKIVVFIHGWEDETATAIGNNALAKRMFRGSFGRAPVIYVLASRFRQYLIDWGVGGDRIHVVTTMFDGGQFDGITRNRPDDGIRLLFLSRFVKEKGVYELLTSFERLHGRFPHLELFMAGEGPEYDGMCNWVKRAGLQDAVTFVGYVRDKDKAQILVDSDIFVFPTYYGEGCPVSLLEAMAAGLPVVTTTVGGIGDFMADGKNGRLLESVTADTVEAALLNLMDNDVERIAMGAYNKKIAWERYEAAIVTENIEESYRRLVSAE